MATAVQVFKDNMIRADTLAAEQEQENKAREERARKVDQLTSDFDNMVSDVLGQMYSATAELQSTEESLPATAEETRHQSHAVRAASETDTRNVPPVPGRAAAPEKRRGG